MNRPQDIDEEHDIIIQAGVVQNDALESSSRDGHDTDSAPSQGVLYEGISTETAALLEHADDEARAEFLSHMKQKQEREADRLTTTSEDLHTKTPFHNMRLWILLAIAVFVIAFVIYWNVFFTA